MNEGAAPSAPDLVIDDCETLWTGVTSVVRTIAVTAGGSGYTVGDILNVADGEGVQVYVATVDGGGAVTGFDSAVCYAGGFGGSVGGAGKTTTGGTGSGCTVNVSAGFLRDVAVTLDTAGMAVGAGAMLATPTGSLTRRTLCAFHAITPGDLSAYSRLRFRFKNTVAIAAGDLWRVCLCSDTVGRVIVDEFYLPITAGTGAWIEVSVAPADGGVLDGSYGSIMLGRGIGAGAISGNIELDDIRASP